MDAPLYYFNANVATRQIREWVAATQPPLQALLLDMSATADLDITSAETISDLLEEMHAHGIEVSFAHVRGSVREKLDRLKLHSLFGGEHIYPSIDLAVQGYFRRQAAPVMVNETASITSP